MRTWSRVRTLAFIWGLALSVSHCAGPEFTPARLPATEPSRGLIPSDYILGGPPAAPLEPRLARETPVSWRKAASSGGPLRPASCPWS